MHTLTSPLKAWPGSITLPEPDEFNGDYWAIWKNGVNQSRRKPYAMSHLYCYAGLELIKAVGGWQMEIPIDEVQAWEFDPKAERTKLVAWLGRRMMEYMDGILDPKE